MSNAYRTINGVCSYGEGALELTVLEKQEYPDTEVVSLPFL